VADGHWVRELVAAGGTGPEGTDSDGTDPESADCVDWDSEASYFVPP
jgi:hypothetical protein